MIIPLYLYQNVLMYCRSDRPMVHVPVENIMSKWYGESEKKLSAIFDACDEIGGAIIFIDEVDALAGSRSTGGMHEATRRVLSVILQKVMLVLVMVMVVVMVVVLLLLLSSF